MKFDRIYTGNWENAFYGLRHPMESYSKGDTGWYDDTPTNEHLCGNQAIKIDSQNARFLGIGPNDMDLAQRMIKAGSPNDKFLRQIFVSIDITGPLYWFKELDTYKVGTTANSTSTMHKLASTPITKECFEMGDYVNKKLYDREPYNPDTYTDDVWEQLIEICETLRIRYNETKDQEYWKELIRLLPESWLQTRTWSANYAVLRQIYHWRKNHRLQEWHEFCQFIETLPYAKELIMFEN